MRKYVLAQFGSDASLDWVPQMRARLGHDELKYRDFDLLTRRRIRSSEADLYRRTEAGVAQATIIVIDPEPIAYLAEDHYISQQAVKGYDFTEADIVRSCALTLVAGTPLAYLPEKIWLRSRGSCIVAELGLSGFAPEELVRRVGGLDGAKVLAARAHAMLTSRRGTPSSM